MPGVLPLDRDRAGVADGVEHPEAGLPRHVAVPGGDEVPAAARVGPGQVRAEPAVAAVADLLLRVLAVDVVDPVLEVPQEADRVEVLPDEVARVPVQAERRPVADRLQRALRSSSSRRRSRSGGPRGRTAPRPRRRRRGSGSSGRRSPGSRRRSSPAAPAGTSRRYFQIDEPVKPTTVSTPSRAAARAVSFISSAARCRTPSGSPSPQIRSGRMPRCRSSIGSSQTAWPARWLEIAQTFRPCLAEQVQLAARRSVVLGAPGRRRGGRPSRRSPARRSPTPAASRHTSSNGQVGPLAGEQGDRSGHVVLLRCSGWSGRRRATPDWCSAGDLSSAAAAAAPRPRRAPAAPAGRRRTTGAGRAGADRRDQVDHLVGERVLVAEPVPRRPPGVGVRVGRLGDQDPAEAGRRRRPRCGRGTAARSSPRSRRRGCRPSR